MLLAFLIRDEDEWEAWKQGIESVQGKSVVHVSDKEPVMVGRGEGGERAEAVDEVEAFDSDDDVEDDEERDQVKVEKDEEEAEEEEEEEEGDGVKVKGVKVVEAVEDDEDEEVPVASKDMKTPEGEKKVEVEVRRAAV